MAMASSRPSPACNGRPRFLALHLQRLAGGCARLALPAPDPAVLAHELQSAAAARDCAVLKLIVTRGRALARGYRFSGAEQAHARAAALSLGRRRMGAPRSKACGCDSATMPLGENPRLAGLKHLNRLEQVLARHEWSDPAIVEALLFSTAGALVSGTMSNVFLVHGRALLTPRLERCGVAGIMREVVRRARRAARV